MNAFHEGLADILEVDPAELGPATVLAKHGWDSLAIISCVALIDECFGTVVSGSSLAECRTVAELDAMVGQAIPA